MRKNGLLLAVQRPLLDSTAIWEFTVRETLRGLTRSSESPSSITAIGEFGGAGDAARTRNIYSSENKFAALKLIDNLRF